jgi:regulator of protease activity HflC (stomatin/prohibitin superfamily)
MIEFLGAAIFAFFASFIVVPMLLGFLRALGLYTIVQEGTCQVYVLFGKVLAVLRTPGLHLLWLKMGPAALIVRWIGRCYVLDMRLDQRYLRSQPVNSEEGAPMGVGVWYEMAINDPVNYLFKNADPQGSLAANVSNAVVRSLSNMPLAELLEDRHAMSLNVRNEVSPKSTEWGYRLGSVYIRKVHFRDVGMIRQIEAKVVNRLRQVTSAIIQDGTNQVNIISSTAERQAAVEFAKAEAIRPQILGDAMKRITDDPEVGKALFDILEVQSIAEGSANVTLVGAKHPLLKPLIAANQESVNVR